MGLLKKVERELLFRKNLKLFEEKLPPVAEAIKKVKIPMKILEKEQKIDVLINDISVYGGDAFALVQKQIEIFEKSQPKLFNNASIGDIPDREDIIAYRYLRRLVQVTGEKHTVPPLTENDLIPLLIVLGVGFGIHIKELIEKYKVQNLILVDVPTYFKLSFYWLDWHWVFDYFAPESKRQLHIVLLDNRYAYEHPDDAYQPIITAIQGMNPATAFYAYYFQHLYYQPPLDPINWLRKSPMLRQHFYGYFDDELWSLEWTIEKIRKGIPLYYGHKKVPEDSVAFVLGAGPSLDKTLYLIEKHKDRAVIISCGSTITSLEKVGLKPDIHVELERTKYTYDVLYEVNREFLKDTFLVTTNAVWTDCFDLFVDGGFVLKGNDTGAILFEGTGAPRLWETGPTVTAMGVSFAQSLGFKEVYLFGVDLGSKEANLHHSKLSNYYNPSSMLSSVKPRFEKQVPGNFGGTVWTDVFFEETGYSIHKIIHSSGIRVYNLSDGIKIQNALPLDPEDFSLTNSFNKNDLMKRIKDNFRRDYMDMIDVNAFLRDLYSTFENFERAIRLIQKAKTKEDAMFIMVKLEQLLEGLGKPGFTLLFHNTYQLSLSAIGHLLALKEEKVPNFMEFFLKLYANFIGEAAQAIKTLLHKHRSM